LEDGVEPLINKDVFICSDCVGCVVGGEGDVKFCGDMEVEVERARCRDGATLNKEFTPYATRARWRADSFEESMSLGTDGGMVALEERVLGETARDASGFNPFAFAPMLVRSTETFSQAFSNWRTRSLSSSFSFSFFSCS